MEKAYLVLENGKVFPGQPIGAPGDSIGQIVFSTSVVGYLETLGDPCFCGQIIMQTFPLIGNYGYIPEDASGKTYAKGYVVRELCDTPSNFRSCGGLDEYLKKLGIPGISGVDTRELTRIIREEGVMNAKICRELPESLEDIKAYELPLGTEPGGETTIIPCKGEKKHSLALINYGGAEALFDSLTKRGCELHVFPASVTAEELLKGGCQGLVLSDGGGDPMKAGDHVEELKKLVGKMPVLGIGMGQLLLALSMGGKLQRLKYGHHGGNQPVRAADGSCFISSQNHLYSVISDSLPGYVKESFHNANDGSCEGISCPEYKCFGLQFNPEPSEYSKGMGFIYDDFISLTGGDLNAKG